MTRPLQALLSGMPGATAVLAGLLLAPFGASAQTVSDAAFNRSATASDTTSNRSASAPEATTQRAVSVVPRLSATETYTDNLYLSSSAMQSAWVTELSPGIRIDVAGARLKASIDYSLTGIAYSADNVPRQSQRALNMFGTLEALEKWLFVDFSGTISQQSISAFGTQSGSNNTAINNNQTEVANYRISPYLRGQLAGVADYEARITRDTTRADAQTAPGSAGTDAMFKLTGLGNASGLGWSADADQQNSAYAQTRETEARRFNLGLSKAFSGQLKLLATVGQESNNYTSIDQQTYGTSSLGLNWTPSELTKLAATAGRRFFGNAHDVSFEHRSGRTVWTFTDVTDVNTPENSMVTSSQGSNYDLLFRQFASIEPDPIARATLVNNYLQNNGINPMTASSSFLTSAVTLVRNQNLSFALLGVRDAILFSASQTHSTRLDILSTGIDDFTNSDVVRQRGFSVNYAHRLTPSTSGGVLLSQQDSSGSSSVQDISLKSLYVALTSKLGKQAAATLGARRILFQSNTAPYAESALLGNFTLQF